MGRLERLLNLVAALIDTERPMTAGRIREEVPGYPPAPGAAFKRAFERDKASLREMGVPLDVIILDPSDPESEQGYRVRRERYDLTDPGLEPEEVAALHLATTQVQIEGGDAAAAIWKLGGIPNAERPGAGASGERGAGSRHRATAAVEGGGHLEAVFGAAADRRTVTFPYKDEHRCVDPWRLEYRNGVWYLVGYDHARQGRRTFRLDRVSGPVVAGPPGAFPAPTATEPLASHSWEMGDEEPLEVRVGVDADLAAWAVANAGVPPEDGGAGSVVLRLRVTNRAALRSWVLGLLDHAVVLGPPSEREAMIAWLRPLAGCDDGASGR